MKILKGSGVLIFLIILYLCIIIFLPVLEVEKQPIRKNHKIIKIPDSRQNISFDVGGLKLSGWLYFPKQIKVRKVPCIVMAQGFAGTKDILLEKYALRFIKHGYAVLTFDYRYFGESEGIPRQQYAVVKQLEDIKGAINYARSRSEINPERIVLWGTSSAGNYGILIASEDERIAAVIGQTPSLDPEKDGKKILKREGLFWLLKLIVHAQRDKGRSRFGLESHTIPAVGKLGTFAMHLAPGFFEGYQEMAKDSKTFKNEICARIMFESHGPDLFTAAKKVKCPVQFHICEKDLNIAPSSHEKIVEILGDKIQIINYPIGHFEIYSGKYFEQSIKLQIDFLDKHLLGE